MEEYPVIKPLDRIALICFEENKAIEKMTDYLSKIGYDVVKREPKKSKEETYSLCDIQKAFFPDTPLDELIHEAHTFDLLEIERKLKEHKQKLELELKACPFCGSPKFGCKLFTGTVDNLGIKSWVECIDECGYQSKYCDTPEEAIRLHNLIAETAKPKIDSERMVELLSGKGE